MPWKNDEYYVKKAIELAYDAKKEGNNPFGSILVDSDGNIIMEDQNTEVTENDITGHPELKIARRAASEYDKEFLEKCTMYNSAESCTMCTGSIYWSGIGRIVFGISKKRLNELKCEEEGSIYYSIHELVDNSGKDIEIIGPMKSMKEDVERPHKDY